MKGGIKRTYLFQNDSPSGPNEVVDSTEGSKVGSGVVDDDDSSGSGKEAVGLNRGIKAIYPSGLAILA